MDKVCDQCGGKLAEIRGGRASMTPLPGEPGTRTVCPTCLAERMDILHEMTDRSYGIAVQEITAPPKLVGGED